MIYLGQSSYSVSLSFQCYYNISQDLSDTAQDLYQAAATGHEGYGVTGAVGGVLCHLPDNVVRPIIFASEATLHVLGEVKNQFVSEAKREASEKLNNNLDIIVVLIYIMEI